MSFKPGSKSKNSFESWESLFRKTLSKDRLLNFTKPAENPIQWIHLLDPFDHEETRTAFKSSSARDRSVKEGSQKNSHTPGDKLPQLNFPEAVVALAQAAAKASGESRGAGSMDLSGWPLIPFSKVQLFKCEKCCLEFCSPVNHRRHLRLKHRRVVHTEKEDLRSQRQELATFWDALSPEEASKIVDVRNLVLEDLIGDKVAKSLSHLLQQPALFALPHSYVKSGAMLLELVQRRSLKPLLKSSELFKVLDGSSEKTFPSFGLNAMQRYLFEGEAGKVGLEAKNLVSSLGLLVELNLVKAFIKDKDQEAWRCQTALVEEEEASRRKRAQIKERKRTKKARQKDLKEKDQKLFDGTRAFLSAGSQSSDDEEQFNASPVDAYDQQSMPISNAYENLYHRLAGEESDCDLHLEVDSTVMEGLVENNELPGELGKTEEPNLQSDTIPTLVSTSQETSCQGSGEGRVSVDRRVLECAANDHLNETNIQAASGSGKMLFKEKRKYPAERSPEARDFAVPFEKYPWKVRNNFCFRKLSSGHIAATSVKEGMSLARPDGEESSANRAAGYRPRQFVGKPVKARKYVAAAQTGATIWAKKALKHSDIASEVTPVQTDFVNGIGEDASCHVVRVKAPEARVEVTDVDTMHETVSSSIDSPLSIPGSCGPSEESILTVKEGDSCILQRHTPVIMAPDSSCINEAGPAISSLSSAMVGSVVIGSLCLSLIDCKAVPDPRGLKSFQDEAEGRIVFEQSEGDLKGSGHSAARVEESVRALNESGAVNCVPLKEFERTGKALKFPSQLNSEEKENREHPPHVADEGKSSRPTVVQAGSRVGRVKVWRPVVSTTCHEDKLGSAHTVDRSVANLSLAAVPEEGTNPPQRVDPEELDQVEPIAEIITISGPHETIAAKERMKVEDLAVEDLSFPSSTYEDVSGFLAQRWSVAVNASDTTVLTLEDDEECELPSRGLCEDTVHVKELRNSSLQQNKDAFCLPVTGNGKVMRGFWKHDCSGSAMVVNRRLSGKANNFHVAPRFRYVPK